MTKQRLTIEIVAEIGDERTSQSAVTVTVVENCRMEVCRLVEHHPTERTAREILEVALKRHLHLLMLPDR